jgi:hypothetical protein
MPSTPSVRISSAAQVMDTQQQKAGRTEVGKGRGADYQGFVSAKSQDHVCSISSGLAFWASAALCSLGLPLLVQSVEVVRSPDMLDGGFPSVA